MLVNIIIDTGSAQGSQGMGHAIHDRLRSIAARYLIDEELTLGLDIGIASVGSAVLRRGKESYIEFAGSRCFETPEVPKTRELRNEVRRKARLARRVIRRSAKRMADIRALLVEAGFLASMDHTELHHQRRKHTADPWELRAAALDRRLEDGEFATILLHIAKHRGFKSNRKTDGGQNAPDDSKKMLQAIAANQELLSRYRTVGEMVAKDEKFQKRKRNKDDSYSHTHQREDLHEEVRRIFRDQRRLGNSKATGEVENRYTNIAFYQRALEDSEHMVGMCPFETTERRTSRHAPSFEKFRFLSKLNTIKIRKEDSTHRRLTRDEIDRAVTDFGHASKSMTWNSLAKRIGQSGGTIFEGVDEKKAKKDILLASGCSAGTKALYDALDKKTWIHLKDISKLDEIASVIAFRNDPERIRCGLQQIEGLDDLTCDALMEAVNKGHFSTFKQAGHISAKAALNVLPHLMKGMVYSGACSAAGYNHSRSQPIEIEDIRNPVVQRCLREAIKQVETLIHQELGVIPGRIVVELARDVGKSSEERGKIETGIERRNSEKERHKREMKELLKIGDDPGDEDLRRFELWKEQNHRCIYTDEPIFCTDLLSQKVQIDHILPRSRSYDNSYTNSVLCLTSANQEKGSRTPWEWRGESDASWWHCFEERVRSLDIKGIKKRNLLMQNFHEREKGFAERNLNDTKYASRTVLSTLQTLYEGRHQAQKRRCYARPGMVTKLLREAWGLGACKDREDDRHHALDAIICAAARNEWLLEKLTRQYQVAEKQGQAEWQPCVPHPWKGFRDDVIEAYDRVFVSRSERRRGRGRGHKDTYYKIERKDGKKVTFERKKIQDVTEKNIQRIKDSEKGNKDIAASIASWIAKGRPNNDLPKSRKGDIIRKIHLERDKTTGFDLNGGHVDNADMIRVDVFSKLGRQGDEFYLVPVYRHQVMNPTKWPRPPDRWTKRNTAETSWPSIDDAHTFLFSLYHNTYIRIVKRIKRNGEETEEEIEGYYRGTDINTASISLSNHNRHTQIRKGQGVRRLRSFQKFNVDRLGRKAEVVREARTWHGEVYT